MYRPQSPVGLVAIDERFAFIIRIDRKCLFIIVVIVVSARADEFITDVVIDELLPEGVAPRPISFTSRACRRTFRNRISDTKDLTEILHEGINKKLGIGLPYCVMIVAMDVLGVGAIWRDLCIEQNTA